MGLGAIVLLVGDGRGGVLQAIRGIGRLVPQTLGSHALLQGSQITGGEGSGQAIKGLTFLQIKISHLPAHGSHWGRGREIRIGLGAESATATTEAETMVAAAEHSIVMME